ncbi:MAG: type II and III secretion system protein [Odoribacteraceae bacterium]|jgi:type IV pilus assembly protein PilQ|nr:type II and III secretion system protein [Odoribacteraceae bacterium]
MKKTCLIVLLAGLSLPGIAQRSTGHLLDSLSKEAIPALNKKMSFSISEISLSEFIRAFSHDAGVNVVIPQGLETRVSNNFHEVRAADILAFLCDEHKLKVNVNGNILSLSRILPPPPAREPVRVKQDPLTGTVSADLKGDPLQAVVKALSVETGITVTVVPDVKEKPVTCYLHAVSLPDALELICKTHGLKWEKMGETIYLLSPRIELPVAGERPPLPGQMPFSRGQQAIDILVDSTRRITVQAKGKAMEELFQQVMHQADKPYRLLTKLEGNVEMEAHDVTIEEFLYQLFKGSKYTCCVQEGIYYAGERGKAELKSSRLLALHSRSVAGLLELLPKPVLHELDVKEFEPLNSLLIHGASDQVEDFARLIKRLDRTVPVILIDVLIVDISDKAEREIGLEYGLGEVISSRSGGVATGITGEVGATGFSKILKGIGMAKLGNVPDDFYLKLRAMEESGQVNIHSTPRLSTMNGSEAKMSIGRTEFYKEERQDYFGTQDPQLSRQTVYKEMQAELSVTIRPVVAGNGSVNLNVKVEQSNFTERLSADGPPGKTTRKFESTIRVMDRETILLGGLEEETNKYTTKGVPWISRVPVLKWLFGSNQKSKTKSRLNILIKPVVIP